MQYVIFHLRYKRITLLFILCTNLFHPEKDYIAAIDEFCSLLVLNKTLSGYGTSTIIIISALIMVLKSEVLPAASGGQTFVDLEGYVS